MRQWYRMSDRPEADKAAIPVDRADAQRWNTPELGFGIFCTVNSFNGARRKENLTRVDAWAIDMDDGTKDQQHKRIHSSPLVPSLVVETKRGYQVYWIAQDGKPEHWNAIVLERLVPFFGADKNARDLCRILRVPGFLHLKDPADPFHVQRRWRFDVAYSEKQMADAFRWVPDQQSQRAAHDEHQRAAAAEVRELAKRNAIAAGLTPTETLWEAIYALDCEDGLRRLSGHWAVSGESYTFHRAPRGHLNIYVNKQSSPCFIDENRRIGSPSGGGPTLAQWLRWFKHDWKTVVTVLKEIYPHLADVDETARRAARRAA